MRALALLFLAAAAPGAAALPQHLSETGLYAAGSTTIVRSENIAFSPQYPLWSDGSEKRRWLYLPPGTAIDASRPDEWDFPPGTRAWKEFSRKGQRIETRFIERLGDGTWRFTTYVWNAQGTDAVLAPAEGIAGIPSRSDCLACHEGAAVPVLGFSAVQLANELADLAARGHLRNLPASFLAAAPRIAAPSAAGRAALGYLHGNCGHCHNDAGPLANVDLALAQRAAAPAESAARTLHSVLSRGPGVLARRMQSKNPLTRMPPLGVSVPDAEGISLVERWIRQDLENRSEVSP
jgi:mono/diheme cytochrome c family protein